MILWLSLFGLSIQPIKTTANGYTSLEKLTTEKCKQQAKQPEKKILKIKILWKFSLQYLS